MSNESHGKTPWQFSAPILTINGRRSHAADGRNLERRATPNPSIRPTSSPPAMSTAVIVSAIGSDAEAKRQSWAEKKRAEREATVAKLRATAAPFQNLSPIEADENFCPLWADLFVAWARELEAAGALANAAKAVSSRSGARDSVEVQMLVQAVQGDSAGAADVIETFLREQSAEAVDAIEFWRDSETVEAVLAAAFPEKSDAQPVRSDALADGDKEFIWQHYWPCRDALPTEKPQSDGEPATPEAAGQTAERSTDADVATLRRAENDDGRRGESEVDKLLVETIAMTDPDAVRIADIVRGPGSSNDKMLAIGKINPGASAWNSVKWGDVLGVSPPAIRQTPCWIGWQNRNKADG